MAHREELAYKKELILQQELVFANHLGAAVFERPKVSLWMILVPLLFLYFIYQMQKYRNGRMKFEEDFMLSRRRAMDVAVEAVDTDAKPDVQRVVRQSGLLEPLHGPYEAWMSVLVEFYMDLLKADGESFESLVRSAYGSSMDYLLALNRLSTVERQFYSAMRPQFAETEGAYAIINTLEERSQQLRRSLAQQIFA
jgi:hypothetical protein